MGNRQTEEKIIQERPGKGQRGSPVPLVSNQYWRMWL